MEDFSLLEWDTGFFGYKVAGIKASELEPAGLDKILRQLRENDFKLAYCFVSPEDKRSNESLKQASGLLADEKITYSINVEANSFPVSDKIIPYDLKQPTQKLITLALQSGIYSRFKIDQNFRNNEFERLYMEWIGKSVSKTLADEVFVYSEDDEILGFITLSIKNRKGSIGLIAVDENQRGKAIGKKLIGRGLLYFKENNITETDVVTQKANSIACRFYESCGFRIKNIVNIYHLWIR
jgi:dTDP-4-amino-4,6-dideoxy-D-galactose acyltransferase